MVAYDFVQRFQGQFDTLASYACLDAATFSTAVNPDNKIMVLDRLSRANDRGAKDAGAVAGIQFGTQWDAPALLNVHDRVLQERAGVCTTFAKAAAHIMAQANVPNAPKIEIVGYTNHVFVIVGRRQGEINVTGHGLFTRHNLPHHNQWGLGWVIVDVWAGAMGYPKTTYLHNMGYPFNGMLNPLKLIMTTG